MVVKHLATATCNFLNNDTQKQFPSLEEAIAAAEAYVGNKVCTKPFPNEETRIYGPGDGTASVIVTRDLDPKLLGK